MINDYECRSPYEGIGAMDLQTATRLREEKERLELLLDYEEQTKLVEARK